jgi:hypothetical protein
MPSDRSQILDLFATGRIDFRQAERLLCLVCTRDRFLTLTAWAILLIATVWSHPPQLRLGSLPQAAEQAIFQSSKGRKVMQDLQLFFNRFLGELP